MSAPAVDTPVADAPATTAPAADKMEDVAAPAADAAAAAESKEATAADSSAASASDSAAPAAESEAPAKEKKPRAPRTPKVKAPAAAASAEGAATAGTSSRGRERKAVQHFAPDSIKKEEIEFIVEEGPGSKLGDIENIKRKMDATNAQDTSLKALFAACFPEQKGGNTKLVIKKHIREFSGYPKANAKDLRESASTKLERYDGATLKAVCQILDISESGSKAKHIEHITEFLESPKSSGKAYSGGSISTAGSKRKSGSSTKKDKDGKEKRGMTSFMLFSQEHRADVRAKHPEMATTEVAKKLGEMWRALSDSKKQKYKDAAAAGKEGKGKKDAGSDSEESSSSEEEEEEEEKQKKESKPKAKKAKTDASPEAPSMSDELRTQLKASVGDVLKDADLTQMSMAKVRALLQEKHGELVVEAHKEGIKAIVVAAIAAKTSK